MCCVCKSVLLFTVADGSETPVPWPAHLQDAAAAGCAPISGLEMFVGQAADQFQLFTGKEAPIDLMRQVVLDSL